MLRPDRYKTLYYCLPWFIGFALCLILFSPGHLDDDTLWQLEQAQLGRFSDWHPPVMAFLWSLILKILPGAWGFFLFNSVFYWLGLTLIFHGLYEREPLKAALLTLAVGFFPSFFPIIALVWKDALFGVCLLMASGLLIRFRRKPWWAFGFAGPFLLIAHLVRYNGFFALIPFVLFFVQVMFKQKSKSIRMSIFIMFLFFAGQITTAINDSLIDKKLFPPQVLLVFDLAGVSVQKGENLLPKFYGSSIGDLNHYYREHTVSPLLWGVDAHEYEYPFRRPGFTETKTKRPEQLINSWLIAVFNHPWSYLRHRVFFFAKFLGIDIGPEQGRIYFEFNGYPTADSPFRINEAAMFAVANFQWLENTIFFKNYLYAIVLILVGLLIWKRRVHQDRFLDSTIICVWWSASLYFFAYLIVGVSSDYRYAWWSDLAAIILLLHFVTRTEALAWFSSKWNLTKKAVQK